MFVKLHLSAMVDLSSEANRVHFIENYELLRVRGAVRARVELFSLLRAAIGVRDW